MRVLTQEEYRVLTGSWFEFYDHDSVAAAIEGVVSKGYLVVFKVTETPARRHRDADLTASGKLAVRCHEAYMRVLGGTP